MVGRYRPIEQRNLNGDGRGRVRACARVCACLCVYVCACVRACVRDVFAIYDNNICPTLIMIIIKIIIRYFIQIIHTDDFPLCLSHLANCRSQFLLDRLGRCIKLFVSTESTSCREFTCQFGLSIFLYAKSTQNYREYLVARVTVYLNEAATDH